MSGHTHIHTHIHTYTHTYTYTHDNYYNPRCAHAHRGLMNNHILYIAHSQGLTNGLSDRDYRVLTISLLCKKIK